MLMLMDQWKFALTLYGGEALLTDKAESMAGRYPFLKILALV